jgi:hypothetical protein
MIEIEDPRRRLHDPLRVAQVGLDVLGRALGPAGQQGSGMRQHERVVIHIDDP